MTSRRWSIADKQGGGVGFSGGGDVGAQASGTPMPLADPVQPNEGLMGLTSNTTRARTEETCRPE